MIEGQETIALDPIEFAPSRVELGLDELGLRIDKEGADWGESQVAVQLTRAQTGSVVTSRFLEPVEMSIPLQVKEDSDVSLAEAAHRLQQKVGIFQANEREPNWIRRDFSGDMGAAGSVGYMIYSAALHGLQGWLMAHRQHANEVILKMLRSPLCYATEEVESETFIEESARVLEWELADVLGTGPGLIRLRVDNLNASDHWRGLIVPFESRDHPQDASKDTTAALTYEAEDLTLRGGAVEAERAGASGKVARHSALTAGWLTILSSEIAGVGHMTHIGVRRLWARIYDPGEAAGGVELQLEFRPLGNSNWSSTGVTVATSLVDDFALVDLGECRPELAALGGQRWEWRLKARAPSGSGAIDIDQIHVLPLEQYSVVTAPDASRGADAQTQKPPTKVKSNSAVGTEPWTNPENAKASDNSYATAVLSGGEVSEYLQTESHGFLLPESAVVLGILVEVERSNPELETKINVFDSTVKLAKAGVPGGNNEAKPGIWEGPSDELVLYGGSDSLWGQTWTAAEINDAGFGAAVSCKGGVGGESTTARVDLIRITVYYTEAEDENRVCFAERSVEFRSDGAYRQHPEDDVWGSLIVEGFNPQAPPSWLENRAVRGVVIPSQGDLDVLADTGDNKIGLTVLHRPAYHFAREAALPAVFPDSALFPSLTTLPGK